MKILIVGGNAAGPSAAAKAKRVNPNAEVIMFEAGDHISTGTCELPYLLSGEIDDYKKIIFFDPESFYNEKGVKVYVRHRVETIDRADRKIRVKNLNDDTVIDFDYDKLILSTGSSANRLPFLNRNFDNSFILKSVSDYLKIKNYLEKVGAKKAVIIGAGYIGIETAEALRELGLEVILLDKEKHPMPGASDEIRGLILNTLIKRNIEFHGGFADPKFNVDGSKLSSVVIEGRFIEFDLLISAVGFRPNNELALAARLDTDERGALKVDSSLRTSDPRIFAAGDNCQVINKITGRPDYLPLATIAHEYGHTAGANAAGGNLRINPIVKNIAVKIFDEVYAKVGMNELELRENGFGYGSVKSIMPNLVSVMPASRKVFGKILYEKGSKRILGADFYGASQSAGYADIVASFIQNNLTADKLSETNFNYTPPVSPFINLLSVLGRRIK